MPNATNPAQLPLAVPTAMHDDASLDRDAQSALVAAVADAGADAVRLLDLTSGEVDELDDDERAAVVAAARRGASGLTLWAGVGAPGPTQLATARRLADTGADVLVVPVGGPPARRVELLGQIAALGLPLVVHHQPGATGVALSADDLAASAREVDAHAVLHEGVPVADTVTTLVAGNVVVLGGLGGLFLPEELEAGAHGTGAATAIPDHLTEVVRRYRQDEHRGAREQHLIATGYLRLEAGSSGTVVRKEGWRQRGYLHSGRVRRGSPLGPPTKAAVTRRLAELGVELRAPWPGA